MAFNQESICGICGKKYIMHCSVSKYCQVCARQEANRKRREKRKARTGSKEYLNTTGEVNKWLDSLPYTIVHDPIPPLQGGFNTGAKLDYLSVKECVRNKALIPGAVIKNTNTGKLLSVEKRGNKAVLSPIG